MFINAMWTRDNVLLSSMDWLKGTSTGNHVTRRFSGFLQSFPTTSGTEWWTLMDVSRKTTSSVTVRTTCKHPDWRAKTTTSALQPLTSMPQNAALMLRLCWGWQKPITRLGCTENSLVERHVSCGNQAGHPTDLARHLWFVEVEMPGQLPTEIKIIPVSELIPDLTIDCVNHWGNKQQNQLYMFFCTCAVSLFPVVSNLWPNALGWTPATLRLQILEILHR